MRLNETAAYDADGIKKKKKRKEGKNIEEKKNEKAGQRAPMMAPAARLEQAALIHANNQSTPGETTQ